MQVEEEMPRIAEENNRPKKLAYCAQAYKALGGLGIRSAGKYEFDMGHTGVYYGYKALRNLIFLKSVFICGIYTDAIKLIVSDHR